MDVYAVMAEVDTRLKTITGMRTTAIGADQAVLTPAAVQYLPDRWDFDQTYGRGVDTVTDLPVVIYLGKSNLRAAVKSILPYLAGSGAKSIKAKLDSATTPYTSCSDFQVVWAEVDYGARLAGTEYLAAIFHCNFTGPGA